MAQRQRTRSPAYRARRTLRQAARKARRFLATESSQVAAVVPLDQHPGSAATVTDGGDITDGIVATSGPEATALQGTSSFTAKFEGHNAEGLAIYSNVDLS